MELKRFFGPRFTVGLIFLFNPVISLFDVLPDFVGYLLLFSALSEIAFLDERLETARRMTLYGAAISAARTVLMLFVFDMDESWVLSCVTLLGIGELFAAIYFALTFFGGVSYVAQRCESENVLGAVDFIKRLWIVFWCVHTACTVVPELAALPQLTLQHDPYAYPRLTERLLLLYKNGATVLLCLVSLIMGLWWLVKTQGFMKGVRSDSLFKATLAERYGAFIEANPLQEVFLSARTACVLLAAGCVLQLNFTVNGIAVLPACAGTLLAAAALWRFGVKDKKGLCTMLCAAAIQLGCVFFTKGVAAYFSAVLLALACFVAVYTAESAFSARTVLLLDYQIEGGLILARIPFVIFLVCRAIYAFCDVYWFLLASIICFALWIFIIIWLYSSLMNEIKLRRRL